MSYKSIYDPWFERTYVIEDPDEAIDPMTRYLDALERGEI